MSNGRIGSPIFVDPINNANTNIIRNIPMAQLAMVWLENCLGVTSLPSPSSILIISDKSLITLVPASTQKYSINSELRGTPTITGGWKWSPLIQSS